MELGVLEMYIDILKDSIKVNQTDDAICVEVYFCHKTMTTMYTIYKILDDHIVLNDMGVY